MKAITHTVTCLIVGVVFAGASLPVGAETVKVTSVEDITEYRLDNGLRVLLFPDDSKPTVTVNLTLFVGSRHEGYGETGMAHLLEHLVFKGTPTHPEVPKVLIEHGAQFNGTTWLDRTNYYETVPAGDENLEFAIGLEADRMMNSFIRKSDLDSEMTVVRNEFERGENSPTGVLNQRMMAVAFEWHNYGKSTIGNRSDIERVPIDNLKAFYKKHYQPDNAMLVVAGQFEEAKALALVEKHFGKIPAPKRKLSKTWTTEPAQDGPRSVTLARVGEVPALGVIYKVPAGSHEDFAAVEVLEDVLSSQPAGVLYKALVETKLASSMYGMVYALHDPGIMTFMAQVNEGQEISEVRTALNKAVAQVVRKGVTQEQVDRSKQRFEKFRDQAMSNTSRLAIQLSEWAAQGDWRLFFLHRDRIEKVTTEDVQRVAAAYLVPNNRTIGMFIPTEDAVRVAIPAAPDLGELLEGYEGRESIAKGEKFDPSYANIQARTSGAMLPGGISVALLPKKTRGETVVLDLTLRYGDEESLKGLETAMGYLPSLMRKGTAKMTRQEIQDTLDRNKATIRGGGGSGVASFSLETKRPHLAEALGVLGQILREPSFPENEFEISRDGSIAGLEEALNDPGSVASNSLSRSLSPYPKGDVRYVPTLAESIELEKAVTVDQVKEVYNQFMNAQHGQLVIVGDFDPQEIVPLVEGMLKGWKSSEGYARIAKKHFANVKPEVRSIETPDKANAFYYAGLTVPMNTDHVDYPAMVMANYILGGTFSARLVQRIRHTDGLSYSIGSRFNAGSQDKRAAFSVYAITNPVNIDKVQVAVIEEIERFIKDGITEEELSEGINGLVQSREVGRTRDSAIAGMLSSDLFLNRTMEYRAKQEEAIKALTTKQVVAAFAKHIDPAKLVVVKAGDFANADKYATPE